MRKTQLNQCSGELRVELSTSWNWLEGEEAEGLQLSLVFSLWRFLHVALSFKASVVDGRPALQFQVLSSADPPFWSISGPLGKFLSLKMKSVDALYFQWAKVLFIESLKSFAAFANSQWLSLTIVLLHWRAHKVRGKRSPSGLGGKEIKEAVEAFKTNLYALE